MDAGGRFLCGSESAVKSLTAKDAKDSAKDAKKYQRLDDLGLMTDD
jgi:hypothetical protein